MLKNANKKITTMTIISRWRLV